MNQTIATILIRIVGTLAGLLGACMLCVTPFMFYGAFASEHFWILLVGLFPFVVGIYFLYVAYLVWFRFSANAVRHVCGMLGFFGSSRFIMANNRAQKWTKTPETLGFLHLSRDCRINEQWGGLRAIARAPLRSPTHDNQM
jgi:hypothetical protein